MELWDIFHRPVTRRKGKDAVNAIHGVLEVTEQALKGLPIPGLKASIGALLCIIKALQVSLHLTPAYKGV